MPGRIHWHDACIRAFALNGASTAELAEAVGCTYNGMRAYCLRYGIDVGAGPRDFSDKPNPKGPQSDKNYERAQRMAEMFKQGLILQSIGDKFGVTRERVRQILKSIGVDPSEGGQRLVAEMRREAKARKVRNRIESHWGVPYEEWKMLRGDGTIKRYEQQRNNSSARGIAFRLSFAEWLCIWKASGKLAQCGRGKGSYCMSRLNDAGGYELGNVHIQLCTENSSEATKQWIGKVKANRGVFCLYPGKSRPYQARIGRKSLGFFATEEEAAAARAVALAQDVHA
jgi:lambda repressor-like predicted transcriptional regulator